MRVELPPTVDRVLAMRLDNVGDVVMVGPALRAIRQALPNAHITLMTSPAGAQVAPMLPWIDETLPLRALWQDASGGMEFDPEREERVIEDMKARAFDAAFIFTSFSQSPLPAAYACYLAGIPVRVGESKEFGGGVLSHPGPVQAWEMHQVDRNLSLVEHAGIDVRERQLELRLQQRDVDAADALLASRGIGNEAFVAIAPGASCAARRYDAERFAAVARMLGERTGMRSVLLGSARERELTRYVRAASGGAAFNLGGETSVGEMAAVIARAALLIANDSGPMHIGDAVGCPMVVLFSGTELESQWAPRGAPSVLLRRPTPCSPCYAFSCTHEMQCLDIPAEEVVEAAMGFLAAASRKSAPVPVLN